MPEASGRSISKPPAPFGTRGVGTGGERPRNLAPTPLSARGSRRNLSGYAMLRILPGSPCGSVIFGSGAVNAGPTSANLAGFRCRARPIFSADEAARWPAGPVLLSRASTPPTHFRRGGWEFSPRPGGSTSVCRSELNSKSVVLADVGQVWREFDQLWATLANSGSTLLELQRPWLFLARHPLFFGEHARIWGEFDLCLAMPAKSGSNPTNLERHLPMFALC